MNFKQAFIAAFYFLDARYYAEKKSGDLVHLLSNMNPFLWADGDAADPATYEEWMACAKKIAAQEPLNAEQSFNLMIAFLKFYHEEFEFAPMWIIEDVVAKTHTAPKWRDCISAAMEALPQPLR